MNKGPAAFLLGGGGGRARLFSIGRFACIAAALLLYVGNHSLLNLYNKYVFQELGFNFPILIILYHQACVYTVLRSLSLMCVVAWPDAETVRSLALPCLAVGAVFGINVMCNNASLVYIPLSLNQCIKALVPGIGLCFYFLHTRKPYPLPVYLAAVATGIGVTMVVVANPGFDREGVLLAFGSTVMAASQNCVASLVLSAKVRDGGEGDRARDVGVGV